MEVTLNNLEALHIEKIFFAKRLEIDLDAIKTLRELDKAIYDKLYYKINSLETDIKYLFNKLTEKGTLP